MSDRAASRERATEEAPRAWQRMLSGRRLDLLHPRPEDIDIGDVARGLARMPRWNGQTGGPQPFSVAQHSLLVEAVAGTLDPALSATARLTALLHDAPEFVIGDLISPFKSVVGDSYKAVEARILAAVLRRFGLPPVSPSLTAVIKHADRTAAFFEATRLAGFAEDEAAAVFGSPACDIELDRALRATTCARGEALFLARFRALGGDDARDGDARR